LAIATSIGAGDEIASEMTFHKVADIKRIPVTRRRS
jgi:hypothetical protein